MIANGIDIPGEKIQWQDQHQWPDELSEIIYIDAFGNCMTGITATSINKDTVLHVSGMELAYAKIFSAVAEGKSFWYENSNGLVELAVNKGSAEKLLKLSIGSSVEIKA